MSTHESDYATLREELARCSPETIEAAIRYQTQRNDGDVRTIVFGILARYLPREGAEALATATSDTRLVEDLGMDSMTLLEVLMTAEGVFHIRVTNEEVKDVLTIGKMEHFILQKVAANAP